MAKTTSTAVLDDDLARKSRQGSETRDMNALLRVRYHQEQLDTLKARAGDRLPTLIRQYADLLNGLLPVADAKGVDPFELVRQTMTALLDEQQPQARAS